jgi:cytochrome c oxidase subunit 3
MTSAAVSPQLSRPATLAKPRFLEPAVLGVLIFIGAEVMFFSGLMSAYNIARAKVPMAIWPPPDQPRLPVESTAANTVVLLVSGLLLWLAVRAFHKNKQAVVLAIAGCTLGGVFVAVQGYEWVGLLSQGLNMQRSAHASFFYLIVGTHGLHIIGGLVGLLTVVRRLVQGTATLAQLRAAQVFWSFVVLIWPVLYVMVYL